MPEVLFPPGISIQEQSSKALGLVIPLQMDPEEAPARVWILSFPTCWDPGLSAAVWPELSHSSLLWAEGEGYFCISHPSSTTDTISHRWKMLSAGFS